MIIMYLEQALSLFRFRVCVIQSIPRPSNLMMLVIMMMMMMLTAMSDDDENENVDEQDDDASYEGYVS